MPYAFNTIWSEEDQEFVGLCDTYPSLSHLDPDENLALKGIKELVLDVWCEQYMDTRDDLALRKSRGDKLNKMEEALLKSLNESYNEVLNAVLEALLPERSK